MTRQATMGVSRRCLAAFWCLALSACCPAGVAPAAEPAGDEFPPELVQWQAHEGNPVFTGAGPGRWDAKIRERGWILRDETGYRMWYTGYDGSREGLKMLGMATSRDGLEWTRWPGNPLYREHWVEDMMVVRHGDTYYMFAEGRDDQAHLLSSPDGVAWTRVGTLDIRYRDGRPLTPGPYGTPTAWFEEGKWRLMYERADAGVWLAESVDMRVWTHVQDAPVLSPGPDEYDRHMIALNQVTRHQGRYYAWYHGSGSPQAPRTWNTNLAVSSDLVHWKKYPGNPLLEDNKSSGIVVHDGRQLRLYTMHDAVHVHFPRRAAARQ